jgi:hypothetical protein
MSSSDKPKLPGDGLEIIVLNTPAHAPGRYRSIIERVFGQANSSLFSSPEPIYPPYAGGKTIGLNDLKLLMAEAEVGVNGQTESRVNEEKNGESSEEGPGTR